jgi:hypothetical protein
VSVSSAEAEVLAALRQPAYPELTIKKAPDEEESYSLELGIKQIGLGTSTQVERFIKKQANSYGGLLARTTFKKLVYIEYLERKRV